MFQHLNKKSVNASSILTSALIALFVSTLTHAEQKFSDDQYEIHYNAFNSTLIPAEVASRHEITRSGNRGLINVAVLEKQEDGSLTPVSADISGQAVNIVQQPQTLSFKEVVESNAIYSISHFQFTNEDLLTINLDVKPANTDKTYSIEMQQTFYVD